MQKQEFKDAVEEAIKKSLPISEQSGISRLTESEIDVLSEGIFNALSGFAKKKASDAKSAISNAGNAVANKVTSVGDKIGGAVSKFADAQKKDWQAASAAATKKDFQDLQDKLVKTLRAIQSDAIKVGSKMGMSQEATDTAVIKAFSTWRNGFSKDPLLQANKNKRAKKPMQRPDRQR